MIEVKAKDGGVKVKISGDIPVIIAEATGVVRAVYNALTNEMGKPIADLLLAYIFKYARMTSEEVQKEINEFDEAEEMANIESNLANFINGGFKKDE